MYGKKEDDGFGSDDSDDDAVSEAGVDDQGAMCKYFRRNFFV